jgi:hypothetical protein
LNPDIRAHGAESASPAVPEPTAGGAASFQSGDDVPTQHRQEIEKEERDLDNRDLRSPTSPSSLRSLGEKRNGRNTFTEEQRREIAVLVASMLNEGEG